MIYYSGCAVGLLANITCGLLLTLCDGALGQVVESVGGATDNVVWNIFAPIMLLVRFLGVLTVPYWYSLANQFVAGWGVESVEMCRSAIT